ncbi:MAG: hydroxymethylbilane synthase [Cyanobacteria bacterium SZAS LIN-2]|nr:hydroxymethylbilane synthase [Cyanobacteria bacterium SZAS LIN-3]MBS1996016.1 hydroxymethylbilane synthase [Cyanobacteria bacterium SZAS LIN-2]MBS2009390.1 hydroxymethylbilane synthase [Cyanobacteria bacterium SZAS TMP-1]
MTQSNLKVLRVGTRESKLARLQTDTVIARLSKHYPGITFEIHPITTGGDKILDRPIAAIGGRGVFVKELEEALLENRVDLVVHSLKDLPTDLPPGLKLACVMDRSNPADVLVSSKYKSLAELPSGATIATSSRRRSAQLLALRPDLHFTDMRGNIPTRLRKLEEGQCDAMILAAAGLLRLGFEASISEYLPLDVSLPAAGQGALAVECRADDSDLCGLLKEVEDADIAHEVEAERAFLDELGSGCSIPAGALGRIEGETLVLMGCVAALDGSKVLRDQISGDKQKAFALGKELAKKMQADGAEKILEDLRRSTPNVVSPP